MLFQLSLFWQLSYQFPPTVSVHLIAYENVLRSKDKNIWMIGYNVAPIHILSYEVLNEKSITFFLCFMIYPLLINLKFSWGRKFGNGNLSKGSSSLSRSSSDQHKDTPGGLVSIAAEEGQNSLQNNTTWTICESEAVELSNVSL